MNRFVRNIAVILLTVGTALASTTLLAQDSIGRVLVTRGDVMAVSADGQTRALQRRSEIFETDQVVTGLNGFAQLRMTDGAQISLKADTIFAFHEYSFDGNPDTGDTALMELVQGGFRTISGTISDGSDDDYQVQTQYASIGVRGTTHEAVIDAGSLFTGVSNGGTTVSNGLGSLDTGLGASYDYSQTQQGQAPQGLLQQPNQLNSVNFNQGTGAGDDDEGEDGAGDGEDGDGDEGAGDGDGEDGEDGGNDGAGDGDDGAGNGNDGAGNDGGAAGTGGGNDGDDDDAPNFDGLGTGNNNQGGGGGNNNQGGGGTTPPANTNTGGNTGGGTTGGGDTGGGATTPPPGGNTDQAINPTQNVQDTDDIENAGQGFIDVDGDGIDDREDPDFVDTDGDGIVDALDDDADGNGIPDAEDPNLIDTDGDGIVDALDDDADGNGIPDAEDPNLIDTDGDGIVDALDDDADGNGIPDAEDPNLIDSDGDGIVDALDDDADGNGIPDAEDPNVVDTDGDGIPDAIDPDADGNGIPDAEDPNLIDTDGDGIVDALDDDADGNGIPDDEDPNLIDTDGDGIVDALDDDADGNGIPDDEDPNLIDSDGDGIVDAEDPTPNGEPTGPVALISPEQVNAILAGGRRGFTLSRNLTQGGDPTIYFGASSNASGGNPSILGDLVDINGSQSNISGDFIFDSTGNVSSSSLGFTNGIQSLFGNYNFDVQWGIWGSGQGLNIYSDVNDNSSIAVDVAVPMLWVSTDYTDLTAYAVTISTGDNYLYWGDQNFIGGSSIGGMTDFFARFNLNLDTGTVTDGNIEFCLACGTENSQQWEVNWEGIIDFDESAVFGSPFIPSGDSYSGTISYYVEGYGEMNEDVAINGIIDGLFTGDELQAFVGGLSLVSDPDMYSDLDPVAVDGIFLLEREDRFSNDEMAAGQDALLVQEDFGLNLIGYGNDTGGDSENVLFIDEDTRYVYRESAAAVDDDVNPVVIIDLLDISNESLCDGQCDIDGNPYGVSWERWDGPLITLVNNFSEFDSPFDAYTDASGERNRAFFARFDIADTNHLQGHYSNVIGYLGQGDAGSFLSDFEMGFDVDFSVGKIWNGVLKASVGSAAQTWMAFFESVGPGFEGNRVTNIDVLSSDGSGTLTGIYDATDDENPILLSSTVDGEIIGAFVDDNTPGTTNVFEQAFVSSFFLQDSSSVETVQGVALIAGEVENRFSFTERESLTRVGLVAASRTDMGVLGGLATSGSNPIFVDHDAATTSDLLGYPTPFYSDFVIRNNSAGVSTTSEDYGVTFGKWNVSNSGDVIKLTDSVALAAETQFSENLYWATVTPVALDFDPDIDPWSDGSLTFSKPLAFQGAIGSGTGESAIEVLHANFEIDFDTGVVTNGVIELCINCDDSGETEIEISFAGGTFNNGFLEGNSITSVLVNDVSVDVDGTFSGMFTGYQLADNSIEVTDALYDAFVGAFNFVNDGYSGSLFDTFLSGTFILERDDRFNVAGGGFNDFVYEGMIVDSGVTDGVNEWAINYFDATDAQDLSTKARFFNGYEDEYDVVISSFDDGSTSTSSSQFAANVAGFKLDWGVWTNAYFQEDNLIHGHEPDQDFIEEPQTWAVFLGENPDIKNLVANYYATYAIGGEGSLDGEPLSFDNPFDSLDISFNLNLFTGEISNGEFEVQTDVGEGYYNLWVLNGFEGEILDGGSEIDLWVSDGEDPGVYGTFFTDYDDYDESYTNSYDIDEASLGGSFVNRISSNNWANGEGILLAFALESNDGSTFLDGLSLNEVDDYGFLDLRFSDLGNSFDNNEVAGFPFVDVDGLPEADGVIHDPFVDLGFILAADYGSVDVTDPGLTAGNHDYIFTSLVAYEETSGTPVFWEIDPATLTASPDAGAVFRRNGGTEYSETPYTGVTWGYWEDGEVEHPTAYLNRDLSLAEDDFTRLFWAVVTAPGSSGPSGTFTYAKRISDLSMTETNYSSTITDLFTTFDIDFQSGSVDNGFIRVCVDGTGCDGATRWESSFTGTLEYGTLQAENITGDIFNPSGADEGDFIGDYNGVFTGYSDYDDPYDVLVGGFNFDETGGSRYVSGLFLVERDDRFNPTFGVDGGAFLAKDLRTSGYRAMFIDADGTLVTGLHGMTDAIWNSTQTVFMDTSGNVYNIGHQDNLYYSDYHYNSGYTTQFGIWYDSDIDADAGNPDLPAFRFPNNLDATDPSNLLYTNALTFVNFLPAAPFSELTGRFSSSQGDHTDDYGLYFQGDVGNGQADQFGFEGGKVNISFDINFLTGGLSNGEMLVQVKETPCSTCTFLNYDLEFDGNLNIGTSDIIFNNPTYKKFYITDNNGDIVGSMIDIDSVVMAGGLSRDGNSPIVSGVFGFGVNRLIDSTPTDTYLEGFFLADGFIEDRLNVNELQGMSKNVGMLIDQSGDGSIDWFFSSGSDSNSPKFGFVDDVTNEGDFGLKDFGDYLDDNPVETVVVENGSGSMNLQANTNFKVGWGYWDTGAGELQNQLDGSISVEEGFSSNPLYWLSAEPADIAELTGTWSYGGISGYIGSDNMGEAINSLDMGFDVAFGTGSISNGFLNVVTNTGTWDATFIGSMPYDVFETTITEARADMHNFNGTGPDGSITSDSDISGVFVGTGSNQGFAAGFNLTDGSYSVSGATLINGRTGL